MRNKYCDGACIKSAAERAHQIVDGRLHRPAESCLSQDHRGHHRPQRKRDLEQVRKREARERGDCDPEGEAQLRPVFRKLRAERSPFGCDAAHQELPCDNLLRGGPSAAFCRFHATVQNIFNVERRLMPMRLSGPAQMRPVRPAVMASRRGGEKRAVAGRRLRPPRWRRRRV